jgi:hypothetical protein
MPSDAVHLDTVRAALGRLWTEYRQAAAIAADEVDVMLRTARDATSANPAPAFGASLGSLATTHFDIGKLAPLFSEDTALRGPALDAAEAAAGTLRDVSREADPGMVELPAGGRLAEAVGTALARVGRAYGAAHVVALARTGRFERAAHAPWLQAYPFAKWTRRERQIAPPIVVTLGGADFQAGGLAEYLDGAVKLVLLVRDDVAPPAPLVRLITPGVYLAQTHDGAQLAKLVDWTGPGVVAWVPAGAAAFVHDPAAGPSLGARLNVLADPPAPRRGLGTLSAAQLTEELRQLEAIAGLGVAGAAGTPLTGTSENPVDRLAAWILGQADLASATAEAGR